MRGKTGAEGGEPERLTVGLLAQPLLQGKEHRWAGKVSMTAENLAGFGKRVIGNGRFDGFNHIATTGMGEDLLRVAAASSKELGHGLRSQSRNGTVELVLQTPTAVDEANFLTLLGHVVGIKVIETPGEAGLRHLLTKDGSGGAITKEAE